MIIGYAFQHAMAHGTQALPDHHAITASIATNRATVPSPLGRHTDDTEIRRGQGRVYVHTGPYGVAEQ